jgi:hypothetical protein
MPKIGESRLAGYGVLVFLALSAIPTASAQINSSVFPIAVGNRWQYEVEGSYLVRSLVPGADTIDALVEWRIESVPASDLVVFQVDRQHSDGRVDSTRCSISSPQGYPIVLPVDADPLGICGEISGLPTDPYRSVWRGSEVPASVSPQNVTIGLGVYELQTGRFVWSDTQCNDPLCVSSLGYRMDYERAVGVGTIEATMTLRSDHFAPFGARNDTLRTRLVGAEIEGISYGTLVSASSETVTAVPGFTVAVVPNPSREMVRIQIGRQTPGAVRLTVFDALGRIVREQTVTGPSAEVSGLASGLYTVRVTAGEAVAQTRLVVAR